MAIFISHMEEIFNVAVTLFLEMGTIFFVIVAQIDHQEKKFLSSRMGNSRGHYVVGEKQKKTLMGAINIEKWIILRKNPPTIFFLIAEILLVEPEEIISSVLTFAGARILVSYIKGGL